MYREKRKKRGVKEDKHDLDQFMQFCQDSQMLAGACSMAGAYLHHVAQPWRDFNAAKGLDLRISDVIQ